MPIIGLRHGLPRRQPGGDDAEREHAEDSQDTRIMLCSFGFGASTQPSRRNRGSRSVLKSSRNRR